MHTLDIPNLRSLHIEEKGLQIGVDDVGHIADLLASHFSSAPNLESIHMSLAWASPGYFTTINNAKVTGRTDTWHQLDKRLAAVTCFKRLDINVCYIHDSRPETDALKGCFVEAFERWTPENAFPILSRANSIVRLSLSDSIEV